MSDKVEFKFVGETGGQGRTKINWSEEAQALMISLNVRQGIGAKDAFETGRLQYNELVEQGEVEGQPLPELPESYTNKNAGSVLYGMKQRFLKRVNKGNAETRRVAEKYGLIEPTTAATCPEPQEVDEFDSSDED